MPTVQDVLQALEQIAPVRYAVSFDKVGLQVGNPSKNVMKAVVTFDRSLASVKFAASQGADLVLAHHPLIFSPLETVDSRTHIGRTIIELIKHDISFIAAHTNWDSARDGLNDKLAALLRLWDVREFGEAAHVQAFTLVVTCPVGIENELIDAATDAGASVIGAYRRCAFQQRGSGIYESKDGTEPAIRDIVQREYSEESRIEMHVLANSKGAVDRAVRRAHPLKEPAIDWYPLAPHDEQRAGRIGKIAPISLSAFSTAIDKALATRCWAFGNPDDKIKVVAVTGGAADDAWQDARNAGADVLVTGEVKQHVALEAVESGFRIIAAGHYATEHPGCVTLRDRMAKAVPDVEWVLFEPKPGEAGRPI